MDALQIFNSLEAVWWMSVGAAVCLKARRMEATHCRLGLVATGWLVLFGVSDVVEVFTGAWWRPWWLLTWKAICVTALVICGIAWWRK